MIGNGILRLCTSTYFTQYGSEHNATITRQMCKKIFSMLKQPCSGLVTLKKVGILLDLGNFVKYNVNMGIRIRNRSRGNTFYILESEKYCKPS